MKYLKMAHYKRCFLVKEVRGIELQYVTYIPCHLAHVGQPIKLQSDTGNWQTGWRIAHIFSDIEKVERQEYEKV